jgi:histidinol dehydrogenase
MKTNLDKILLFSKDSGFKRKIEGFYSRQKTATKFPIDKKSKEIWQVLDIIRNVSSSGDKAVVDYTRKFDGVNLKPSQFRVEEKKLKEAHRQIDKILLKSIRKAIRNVKQYQKRIYLNHKSKQGIKYVTLDSVGICVPGAAAPLFSTVIMCAVPAQVAGVKRIVVVSPPRYNNDIHPVTLAVCYELGIRDVFRVGGAQAVAALASEKGTIPQVSKIIGPGNKWVQTAKKMVGLDYVSIESIAGPSEVLILANDFANPEYVAADMLSQAYTF